jgi:hypothetical protein
MQDLGGKYIKIVVMEQIIKVNNLHYKIPLEVELDIREFIENCPSRESHYSSTVKTGRKYIELIKISQYYSMNSLKNTSNIIIMG